VCIGPKANAKAKVLLAAEAVVSTLREDGIQSFIDVTQGPSIAFGGSGMPLQDPDMTILVGSKQ
jgi:hypothetical protein